MSFPSQSLLSRDPPAATDALIYVQNRKIELNDGSSSTKGRCNLTASTHATLQSCNGTPGRIKVDALIEAEGIVLLSFDTCFHAGKSS